MKEIDFSDMSPASFREAIEYFADSSNEYSKEELHSAFLLENLFVNKFGEASANEFFEAVANSSETVTAAYEGMSVDDDPADVIRTQFDLIGKLSSEN